MDIKNTKLELMQHLLETENAALLEKIKKLVDKEIRQSGLTREHKKILDQRLAKHKSNPAAGSRWKDVKNRIKERL